MSLKFKIVYNTAIQFVGRFGTSLIGFITTLVLARSFGAAGYGVYAKIYTLASFFFLLIDFGLNAVYVRRYQNDLSKINRIFKLRGLIFLFSLVIILLFLSLSGSLIFQPHEKLWGLMFVPTILLFGFYTTFNIVFQLKLRYDLSVSAGIIGGLVGLILLLFLLKFGLMAAIFSLVVGYLVTVLIAWYFARKLTPFSIKPLSTKSLSLLKEALPLGAMLFLNTMYSRADIFVIAAVSGDKAVGIYSLAYKFFEFPLAFAAFFANSVFPHYVATYKTNQTHFWQIFKKATIGLVAVSLLFTLGGLILAPYMRLIKPEYALSGLPLQILVLSYPIFFITSALSWLVFILKKEKALIWIYGVSFLLNIVANILLVPQYTYLASSWITVLVTLMAFVVRVVAGNWLDHHHPQEVKKLGIITVSLIYLGKSLSQYPLSLIFFDSLHRVFTAFYYLPPVLIQPIICYSEPKPRFTPKKIIFCGCWPVWVCAAKCLLKPNWLIFSTIYTTPLQPEWI